MLHPIYYESVIDLMTNNNFITIPVMQGDSEQIRYVKLSFIVNNTLYELSKGTTAYVIGTKPDGKTVMRDCTVENHSVIFDISAEMASTVGQGQYKVIVSDSNGNHLSSFPFYLAVRPNDEIQEITSSNDFQALINALNRASQGGGSGGGNSNIDVDSLDDIDFSTTDFLIH